MYESDSFRAGYEGLSADRAASPEEYERGLKQRQMEAMFGKPEPKPQQPVDGFGLVVLAFGAQAGASFVFARIFAYPAALLTFALQRFTPLATRRFSLGECISASVHAVRAVMGAALAGIVLAMLLQPAARNAATQDQTLLGATSWLIYAACLAVATWWIGRKNPAIVYLKGGPGRLPMLLLLTACNTLCFVVPIALLFKLGK